MRTLTICPLLRVALLALVALLPSAALAWGATGHRITGALAEPLLSASAQAAVMDILGPETLAEAATWADEQRSNPAPFWQDVAGPWHYVTVPAGMDYADVGAPEEGDAFSALTRFAATLKDPDATPQARRLALRFAVHVIGDLHQPLHAGNGTDRGGNDERVTWFREPSNLHRVWDSSIINGQELSYSEWVQWLSARLTPAQIELWMDADPEVWIAESTELRDGIYPQQSDIGWRYQFDHIASVRQRLTQGGVRIAAWLNLVFAAP